jgi:PTS system nitrogen regulatory IIA component
MIDLAELVTPDRVVLDLKGGSKRQVLQALSELASRLTSVDAGAVLEALIQREKLGTTGLGEGIAIPHAKVGDLGELVGLFARLAKPVDFDALDGEPVDLVFLLLAPDDAGADHLKALARIARILRDQSLCRALREAHTVNEAREVLSGRSPSATA